jgi:hypothetical protein
MVTSNGGPELKAAVSINACLRTVFATQSLQPGPCGTSFCRGDSVLLQFLPGSYRVEGQRSR